MSELAYMSAREALARFRTRELSPVELVDAVIARAEVVEPTVNALCHTRYDEAMVQARAAERRYHGRGAPPRQLEGIPVAVKEEEPIAGQPWTQGSLIGRDDVADHSSLLARRILDAGAIVHARTTMSEFGAAPFTRSRLWGVTRNPWNPQYAAGGSSGGSGAALASGTTTLATGSDIAGSIRIPASCNGVVGFKPPLGRVPVEPPFNYDRYTHSGPMARSVADAALLYNVVAGPDPSDITTLIPGGAPLPDEFPGIDGFRVAVATGLGDWAVDPDIRTNTLDVARSLQAHGAVVEEVALSLPRADVLRAAAIHLAPNLGFLETLIEDHRSDVTAYLIASLANLRALGAGGTQTEGYEIESRLWSALASVLRQYDVLICPTVVVTGLLADEDYAGDVAIECEGETFTDYINAAMALPFNILGPCPVLAVPSGFADNGVPTGVQVVGWPYEEISVFRVAAALEQTRPWADIVEVQPAGAAR